MKNRKSLYILIPITLFVWGIIGYRVFNFINDNSHEESSLNQFQFENDSIKNEEAPQMIWVYRDPFLDRPADLLHDFLQNSGSSNNISDNGIKDISAELTAQQKVAIEWPQIQYHGIIKNNTNGKFVAAIAVNQKQYLLSTNETVSGVTMISANNKQVTLKFNEEIKTFQK